MLVHVYSLILSSISLHQFRYKRLQEHYKSTSYPCHVYKIHTPVNPKYIFYPRHGNKSTAPSHPLISLGKMIKCNTDCTKVWHRVGKGFAWNKHEIRVSILNKWTDETVPFFSIGLCWNTGPYPSRPYETETIFCFVSRYGVVSRYPLFTILVIIWWLQLEVMKLIPLLVILGVLVVVYPCLKHFCNPYKQ